MLFSAAVFSAAESRGLDSGVLGSGSRSYPGYWYNLIPGCSAEPRSIDITYIRSRYILHRYILDIDTTWYLAPAPAIGDTRQQPRTPIMMVKLRAAAQHYPINQSKLCPTPANMLFVSKSFLIFSGALPYLLTQNSYPTLWPDLASEVIM